MLTHASTLRFANFTNISLLDKDEFSKVISLLGDVYKEEAASAFGLLKFVQSVAAACSYFYSPYLGFYWQLLILSVLNITGTAAFVRADKKARSNKADKL